MINNTEREYNKEIHTDTKNIKENITNKESIKNKNQNTTIKHILYY